MSVNLIMESVIKCVPICLEVLSVAAGQDTNTKHSMTAIAQVIFVLISVCGKL